MPTSVGPDGIDVPGLGWTTQSTQFNSNKNLESAGNLQSYQVNPPAMYGYLGWTMITEDAISSSIPHPASNVNILSRIYVAEPGTTSKVDCFPLTNVANITAFYLGLYSTAGVQLAVTAESHASLVNNAQVSLNWTTPVVLTGNTFYYLAMVTTWATAAPTFAGCLGASAASLNANLTGANPEAATNVTQATLPATYTMTAGANTLVNYEYFLAVK